MKQVKIFTGAGRYVEDVTREVENEMNAWLRENANITKVRFHVTHSEVTIPVDIGDPIMDTVYTVLIKYEPAPAPVTSYWCVDCGKYPAIRPTSDDPEAIIPLCEMCFSKLPIVADQEVSNAQ